jgi:hypothetical protein
MLSILRKSRPVRVSAAGRPAADHSGDRHVTDICRVVTFTGRSVSNRETPRISLLGTACHVRGAKIAEVSRQLAPGETTPDKVLLEQWCLSAASGTHCRG